ncbi:glycosyl transferase [Oleiphilus sp. HI0071]|uniref:glycosyl transferase family protein n=1 Tax=unclassified Oleiphilus TaxID=2631174 RepID=UPI0007C40C58|nr:MULTISPECIES: glycosyl transferase family protein [unclassified Oleiphilus]KZY71063.1 glycosyl transferase [Oleiphilus sp. HI0065]KZY82756.1 glycosyl transferase [Oleiphilus sp. HI0071]KZY93651.1 glycosyl transferase [Oleiphilus sp. HI0073]KZZ51833.1 glycosyl transferase [Oleiphilus sp. HI0122]KZZ70856.1 glycosyl transferase [Oleiphilus sp. HI0130]KZZ82264.1 glycosyl transferase [Oleiphilus sp. HI0133]
MNTHENIRQSVSEHSFAQYVRILGKGKKGSRSFTLEEAKEAMGMILRNQAEPIQLGAFLMLIRVKEESPEELAGFVSAVKDHLKTPEIHVDLDWSSYAGKRRHLPWFIFSACLVSQLGYRVFMHGASGHTNNRIYTETIINKLGLNTASSWSECQDALAQSNFCYMPLNSISPKLAELIDLRSTLGLRSPVHSLSRLINPLNAPNILQGVFHPPYLTLHQEAARLLEYKRTVTMKGEGGEIERNPDNACVSYDCTNGELTTEEWPAKFSRRHTKPAELSFEDMLMLWCGDSKDEYGEAAIITTAALALKTIQPALTQQEAMEQAEQAWSARDTHRFQLS